MVRFIALPFLAFFATAAQSGELVFESKPTKTHLIELFTSEGCSSCLPAEAWLSGLKNEPRLWQEIVPIAFHVDYWDHLGWRDPFASKTWTDRQTDYSAHWKGESVYTPCFVLDGVAWRRTTLPPSSSENVGILKIVVQADQVSVTFSPVDSSKQRYEIHVARLGVGLGADVTAGENKGRKLEHDFVVLGLSNESMKSGRKEMKLPAKPTRPGSREAIAAWVTLAGQLPSIQAVGGWLE